MIDFLKGILDRSKITRNTTPKIVAILFALVLWMYVMGEVNPETEIVLNDIKVQLLNVEELKSSGLVIIDQKDFNVDVKVAGRRNEVYQISPKDIKVTADLRGFNQGVNSIPLEISQPVNITIKDIRPQQIKVRLDKVVQKQKDVEIVRNGIAAQGYEPGDMTITPRQILVEGPETKVNSVAKVIGEINIDGSKENVRNDVPLKAVDDEGKEIAGVDVKTKYVNVYVPILRVKNVDIKPQIIGTVKEGYKITKIEVDPAVVTLKGKEKEIESYGEVLTETINVEGLDTTLTARANLKLSENIKTPYLDEIPEITITVEKIETKEFTFNTNEISVNNLNYTLTTNIGKLDKDIKVKISDVRSVLEAVKKNDLELVINAEGLKEGTYRIPVALNKGVEFEGVEITPKEIEIEIYKKENDKNNTKGTMDNSKNDETKKEIKKTYEPGN
jgi:YbbR domain-containing protein